MNTLAFEFVNDNSISAIAFAFFSALFGAISVVIVQLSRQRTEVREARESATLAAKQTQNVSNGFASNVNDKLDTVITAIQQVRKTTDDTSTALREHLEWHLNERQKNADSEQGNSGKSRPQRQQNRERSGGRHRRKGQ